MKWPKRMCFIPRIMSREYLWRESAILHRQKSETMMNCSDLGGLNTRIKLSERERLTNEGGQETTKREGKKMGRSKRSRGGFGPTALNALPNLGHGQTPQN